MIPNESNTFRMNSTVEKTNESNYDSYRQNKNNFEKKSNENHNQNQNPIHEE